MENISIEEEIEKYPHLKDMNKYTIFTTEEDIKNIKNGNKIIVHDREVYVEFIKRILTNENYYNKTLSYFNNETNEFNICYIIYGDTSGKISYNKNTIIKSLENLFINNRINMDSEQIKKFNTLKEIINYKKFVNNNKDKFYEISIDNIKYNIPLKYIYMIMELSDDDFNNICINNNIKTVNNIPKEHLIYAAFVYYKKNNILKNYNVPSIIEERMEDINDLQIIDLESLNTYLKTEDTKYMEIEINPDIRNSILKNMPNNISTLEKAIYIYIKMCKTFTYDDEYYAVGQKGEATIKHKDPKYISNITLDNNKIVCYEFNLIYSKLLNELGINFKSDYKNLIGEAYGMGHANLEFRSDKYLIQADSVTSILQGDIVRSKLNQPLVGLKCINTNDLTRIEFKKILEKIYKLIIKEEKTINNDIKHTETFDDIMKEYNKTTTNIKEVSIDEKIDILIKKVNKTNMTGIDSFSYLLQLKKILFNEDEKKENVGITIIRNNNTNSEKISMASAIIYVNNNGITKNIDDTKYFYYMPGQKLIPINKDKLQKYFNDDIYGYIDGSISRIPGIDNGGRQK